MNLDDLKLQPRWVCYGADKAPINPRTGTLASSIDPSTWTTYIEAFRAQKRWRAQGVGIVFTGDGLVGIDIDDCVKDDGALAKYAKYLLGLCGAYVEWSPSGTGLHIIGTATIPKSVNRKMHGVGIEVYDNARYFTFTGNIIESDMGTYDDVANVQDVVDTIMADIAHLEEQKKPVIAATVIDPVLIDGDERDRQVAVWIDRAVTMMRNAVVGTRHNTRIKAGRLLGGAIAAAQRAGKVVMTIDDAVTLLYDANLPDDGEEDKERLAILWGIESGMESPLEFRAERRQPSVPSVATAPTDTATLAPSDAPAKRYEETDIGNGQRFVDVVQSDLLWVPQWGDWVKWTGKRWERIDITAVRRIAHDVVMAMYHSANQGGRLDTALAKWATKSASVARINAMIESAQPYLVVDAAIFDTHLDIINVGNGIVDLRTGRLSDHDRTKYFTKVIDIDYDMSAKAPQWKEILATIFDGDTDLIDYIHRAVGYTLTGRTDEHCLFFCYGIGKNGKSTFMNALQRIMGDYATTTSVEALLDASNRGENASPYMAQLPGKRIAVAQEMPEGRRMNESLIKSITGGDRISTRDLYKSVFEFVPTHHLWISGNHKPRIAGTDDGIWRRLRIVPFTVTIPAEKRRDSRAIEADIETEKQGILSWMIRGAQLWYMQGLGMAKAVQDATDEYRGEEDAIARFIAEECELGTMYSVGKALLYNEYQRWAQSENDKVAMNRSQKYMVRHMVERYACILGGNGRSLLVGIKLRYSPSLSDAITPRRSTIV